MKFRKYTSVLPSLLFAAGMAQTALADDSVTLTLGCSQSQLPSSGIFEQLLSLIHI